jgi:hypothetical protein
MARWKLMASHYLNVVEKIEWECKEVDRTTGRERRKQITVPLHLDILDPSCWTNRWGNRTAFDPGEGEIVVCQPGTGQPTDMEFHGDPTPDMMPLDDEAKEISASFEHLWRYKPEGTETSFSQSLIDNFQAQMSEAESKKPAVEVAGLADLVAAMTAQTTAMQAMFANQQRRV